MVHLFMYVKGYWLPEGQFLLKITETRKNTDLSFRLIGLKIFFVNSQITLSIKGYFRCLYQFVSNH